jgi:transposase
VDFFEVTVEEDGEFRKTQKFVMRLMYSGRDFVRLYDRADQLSFLDAHVRAFEYLGGVPHRVVYDNLSAAVKKTIGSERRLTERFMALCSHYLFEPCFARPGEGHDKGGVEARGKGIRLRHLTPIPRGKTLAEISEIVMAEVEMAFTGEQRFAQERGRVVVMDNLSSHKGQRVRELIESRGCELPYPPPYSPDLNPIEEAFSKVKGILRKARARTREALIEAIGVALTAVSASDTRGFFEHCGYRTMVQPF